MLGSATHSNNNWLHVLYAGGHGRVYPFCVLKVNYVLPCRSRLQQFLCTCQILRNLVVTRTSESSFYTTAKMSSDATLWDDSFQITSLDHGKCKFVQVSSRLRIY